MIYEFELITLKALEELQCSIWYAFWKFMYYK